MKNYFDNKNTQNKNRSTNKTIKGFLQKACYLRKKIKTNNNFTENLSTPIFIGEYKNYIPEMFFYKTVSSIKNNSCAPENLSDRHKPITETEEGLFIISRTAKNLEEKNTRFENLVAKVLSKG